ncbi:MAG: MCE family protein [Chloroflexi bacterium]|nr:MAG: MCE family protein [Chloroflexota bacterium]
MYGHRRRIDPLVVGVATIAVIVLVLVGVGVSGLPGGSPIPVPWSHNVDLEAQLADADSLAPHASVEIAGVKVGEVVSIQSQGDKAVATMRVDSQYADVHRDATVLLRPHGFFGPKFLEIVPGTAGAPLLASSALIPEGQTVLPVDLDQILHALGQTERDSLQTAIIQLGQAAAGRGDDVSHLVASARTLTSTLLDPVAALDSVAPNLSDMLVQNESFNAAFAQVPLDQLVANTDTTLAAFAASSDHLQSLLTHADSTLTTLDQALSGQGGNLHAILDQVPGVIDRLNEFNSLLGAFGANLRGLQPGQPVDATPGIIGAIENVRSALAGSDPCTKNPTQPCSPFDNREHYVRVELFGLVPNVPIPCSILPSGPLHNLPCTASAPASGTEQDTLAALLGA